MEPRSERCDDPDDAHLVERFVDSQTRLSGGFLTVVRDRVRLPDGGEATREYIKHPVRSPSSRSWTMDAWS